MGFAEQLFQAAVIKPIQEHKLFKGSQTWPAQRFLFLASWLKRSATEFPQFIAKTMAICDHRPSLFHLTNNFLEEEGFVLGNHRLTDQEEKAHTSLLQPFLQEIEARYGSIPPSKQNANWFESCLKQGDWISPTAYFCVGMEFQTPPTFQILVPILEAHGFQSDQLVFFDEHMSADVDHAEIGCELLVQACQNEEDRQKALKGARKGGIAWWSFLNQVHAH